MIDIHRERLLPMREVPAYLESRGLGRRVSQATVYRWIARHNRGARLETVNIGGYCVTSLEALQRWIEARSTRTPGQRQETSQSPNAAPLPSAPRPEHRASVHLLTELRVAATELDRLIDTLHFPESTRRFAAGLLFRAGLRSPADLREQGLAAALAIKGVGVRSAAVVEALWAKLPPPERESTGSATP